MMETTEQSRVPFTLWLELDRATKWAQGFWNWMPSFFTNWSLAVFISDAFLGVPAILVPTARFMLCSSSTGGLYITLVKRKLVIRDYFPVEIRLEGWWLVMSDLLVHQVPLYVFIAKYHDSPGSTVTSMLPGYLVLALFCWMHPIRDRYRVSPGEAVAGILATHGLLWVYEAVARNMLG